MFARLVVRIMIMVPLYAISSLISLFSLGAAFVIDAIRDIYEVSISSYVFDSKNVSGSRIDLVLALLLRSPSLHFQTYPRISIPCFLNVLTLCILPRLL